MLTKEAKKVKRFCFASVMLCLAGCETMPMAPIDPTMKVGPDTYLVEVSSYARDAKKKAIAEANKKCASLNQEILVLDVKEIGDPEKLPQIVETMFRCLGKGHKDLNQEPLQRTHARDVVPGKTVIAPKITNNTGAKP